MTKTCIGIIGAGKVGSETANKIMHYNLADCILFDESIGLAQARALDLSHSASTSGTHVKITACDSFSELKRCNVIVVTAGLPRKEGMCRDDLFNVNLSIIKEVADNIKRYAKDAIVIMVTNPLDTMSYALWRLTGLPSNHIIGMAGELDSARFRHYISIETNVDSGSIETLVLGSHGDLMIPLVSHTHIRSTPLTALLPEEKIRIIAEKTRDAGGTIVKLSGNGSGFYAAASCITEMINSIINDKKKILCCSVKTSGEYDLDSVYIGLPTVLGKNGVEKIMQLNLPPDESDLLKNAAQHLIAMQVKTDTLLSVMN
ncbi:MAG TPA: malate dehydrogenase [Chitinispirillaceae bacterium]|nr:malate dehydrogenase [Chitinispirillaceae bacterium]